MSGKRNERLYMLLSIMERGKGRAYIEMLGERNIRFCFQTVGFGTAPSEMMDIFGLGSNDKDVVVSYTSEKVLKQYVSEIDKDPGSNLKYRGLVMVMPISAINRVVAEIVARNAVGVDEKGAEDMEKSEHKHSLIFITINQGYTDEVMQEAKKYGATGGTVIRARLVDKSDAEDLVDMNGQEEKEIVLILASNSICSNILENVNAKFGMKTDAKAVVCSVPVDKAFKI